MGKNRNEKKPKQKKVNKDVEFAQELGQQQEPQGKLAHNNKQNQKR